MHMAVDLDNFEEFVNSEKFTSFLVNNTTDFATAALVLQTLFDKVEELKQ